MKNWSSEENEAMKGYIVYAIRLLNADNSAEYGSNVISDINQAALFRYLNRATDDLTADEARAYYLADKNS